MNPMFCFPRLPEIPRQPGEGKAQLTKGKGTNHETKYPRPNPRQAARSETKTPEKGELMMMATAQTKCAHLPCKCMAPSGEKYCGQFCKEAGSSEVEIACQCDHGP